MKPGSSAFMIRSRASRSGRVYTEDRNSGGTSGVLTPRSDSGFMVARRTGDYGLLRPLYFIRGPSSSLRVLEPLQEGVDGQAHRLVLVGGIVAVLEAEPGGLGLGLLGGVLLGQAEVE